MIILGEVVNVVNSNDSEYKNRIQVKIQPIHSNLSGSDLPWIRPLIQPENEFGNLQSGDKIYIYTEDKTLNELYYLGKYNTSIDLNDVLSNIDEINSNIPTPIKSNINEYSLNDNRIKIINTQNQILFMNGEDNFTLIAEKSNGICFYLGSDQIKLTNGENFITIQSGKITLESGESNITMTKDGEIKIYAGENNIMTLLAETLLLGANKINIGGNSGYVVTSPTPGISTNVNGMQLSASTKVKSG